MDIAQALRRAAEAEKWSPTQVAATAGVTENTARRWMSGANAPGGDQLMSLRRGLPGFAELLDSKDVSAA